jgi:hypothetical protein
MKIHRHTNFRLLATFNGETSGFSSKERNILPSNILLNFPHLKNLFSLVLFEKLEPSQDLEPFRDQLIEFAMNLGSYLHFHFILAALNGAIAVKSSLHVLGKGYRGSGLMNIEKLSHYFACKPIIQGTQTKRIL